MIETYKKQRLAKVDKKRRNKRGQKEETEGKLRERNF
jgi:hypothetical protein